MKKTILAASLLLMMQAATAQSLKVPVGKKFQATTEMKITINTTAMGQNMEMQNSSSTLSDYELKSVTNSGYTLINTIKHIKGSFSMMGQEQSFDSDDASARSNPQLAEAFKILNQPNEVVVENSTATSKGDLGKMMRATGAGNDDQAKFIFKGDANQLKEGSKWTDSSGNDGSSALSQYSVTKSDDTVLEILVNTNSKANTTISQNGMDIKRNLKGTIVAKRVYDKATGMMISEQGEVEMSGTMAMMGQESPLSIKGKTNTTVK